MLKKKNANKNSILDRTDISNQRKALVAIVNYLVGVHNGNPRQMEIEEIGGNFMWVACAGFDIVLTITNGYQDKECVKIEEIKVDENLRGHGIGSKVIHDIIEIGTIANAKIGLWVEKDNDRLINFYTRHGFETKETLKDHWMEYN